MPLTGEQDPHATWVVKRSRWTHDPFSGAQFDAVFHAVQVSSSSGATDGQWICTCASPADAQFIADAFNNRNR